MARTNETKDRTARMSADPSRTRWDSHQHDRMSSTESAAEREFVRAWHAWRHTPLPVESFRRDRSGEPSFTVEFALHHLRGHVHGLASAFAEGRRRDYAELVANHLERLHEAEADLENGPVPEAGRAPYREYVAATRLLLHRLLARASERAS